MDAASLDAALEILVQRNLLEIQVFAVPDHPSAGPPPPVSLTSREAGELSQHVAQVSTADLPLSAGLRAAAEETTSRRVALALRWIAGQLDQGRSLEETLTVSGRLLPAHISGLILAAARTGSLGEALFELVELQQKTYSLRRELAGGLLYPLVVLLLATGILALTGYYVTGAFKNIFTEFGLRLPMFTQMLLWWRDTGIWFVGGFVASLLLLMVILRLVGGARRWCLLRGTLPFLGALWRWTGAAEWSGLLSVLLRHQVPLPEALRCAGRGVRDAQIGYLSQCLADGVARGRSLSQMLFTTPQLPAALVPMVEWGEKMGNLPESFRVGQEMLSKRARMRALLLQSILPPILFICIGCAILFVVMGLFMPLIDLISKLS